MKQHLLHALALTAMTFCSTIVMAQTTVGSTVDTYVRKANTAAHGSEKQIEIQTSTAKNTDFVALFSFAMPSTPAGQKIKSATLRLVTERIKGNAYVNVYAFKGDVANDSKYENLADAIAEARQNDSLTAVKLNGQWNVAVDADKKVDASHMTVDAWTTTIDLTDYAKSLADGEEMKLMVTKQKDEASSTKFFATETPDITVTQTDGTTATFVAADLVPQLTLEYEEDNGQVTADASADTWVRSDNSKSNNGAQTTMEIQTNSTKPLYFYGLLSFIMPTPEAGQTLEKAQLRLVTERIKGDREINIYPYEGDVADGTGYDASAVAAALSQTTVANFKMKGQFNVAVGKDAKLTADNMTVDKWTNYVNITDYAKTLAGGSTMSLLLAKAKDQASSSKIFTKEATDITATATDGSTATFAAADLVPQLILSYGNGTNGVKTVKVVTMKPAHEGIYTLSGQRVSQMNRPGIYIVNGKKIIKK